MMNATTDDSMILPQTAEYALRAIVHIAARQDAGAPTYVRADDVAAALDVPRNYLAKTLHQLARSGVLVSTRGPTGGFRLAVPAGELTLERVASQFAEPHGRRCLLGSGPCGSNPGCPVHARWRPVAGRLSAFFSTTTIADLLGATPVADAEGIRDDDPPFPSDRAQPRRETRLL